MNLEQLVKDYSHHVIMQGIRTYKMSYANAQDVFYDLINRLSLSNDVGDKPLAWYRKCYQRECQKFIKKDIKRAEVEKLFNVDQTIEIPRAEALNAVFGLSDYKTELSLVYLDNLSEAEAAKVLGIEYSTLRKRLERGRMELRKQITLLTQALEA